MSILTRFIGRTRPPRPPLYMRPEQPALVKADLNAPQIVFLHSIHQDGSRETHRTVRLSAAQDRAVVELHLRNIDELADQVEASQAFLAGDDAEPVDEQMPDELRFSERALWEECPAARDVLARLARMRRRRVEDERVVQRVLDLRSSEGGEQLVNNLQAREMLTRILPGAGR